MLYWLLIAGTLVYMKWKEGRAIICGIKSKKRIWMKGVKGDPASRRISSESVDEVGS